MPRKADIRTSPNDPNIENIDFRFTIRNVRQLTTTISSQVYVSGVPWQVKLKKSGENVTIELCCKYSNKTSNWSCAARAVFKLLSHSSKSELYEKRQDVVAVFSSELLSISRNNELVKWNDLFDSRKQYICNNGIMVDVSIQAERLRDDTRSRLIEVETVSDHARFRFKLFNVRGVIAMDSPEFSFRTAKCQLTISKRYPLTKEELVEHKNGYLGVWLASKNMVDTSSYAIQVIFRLLSHQSGGKHFQKFADNVEHNRFNFSSRLIPLLELYKSQNEYVNDSIIMEVDIKAENINNVASLHNNVKKVSSIVMECILCFDNMIDGLISSTPCGHLFCRKCITTSLMVRAACPICNKHVFMKDVHDVYLPSIQQNE